MRTSEANPEDQQLVRYLLGRTGMEESEYLDEASIVDDRIAWRLRLLEDDLVDAYVCGELDAVTRIGFECVYLNSPRKRRQVAFAANLLAAVDRQPGEPAVAPERVSRITRVGWPLLAAAAALLVAGSVLVFDAVPRRPSTAAAFAPPAGGGHSW